MNGRDIVAEVVEYYEGKLAAFGATPRGVDWKDQPSQLQRFAQLVRGLGLEGRRGRFSLLDFGCGYGALLPFLIESGFDVAYTGYDRSQQMIDEARRAHGGVAGAAFTSDWSAVPDADYAVASGVFNVRLAASDDEWREHVIGTLAALNEKAAAGWAVNFLTAYADADRCRSDLYYAEPACYFDWCRRHASPWVWLLHDYELYEFTIGITRHPR
jgi:SAM-dependent methyltransferase